MFDPFRFNQIYIAPCKHEPASVLGSTEKKKTTRVVFYSVVKKIKMFTNRE
jgi:hypothetical protein